MPRQARGGKPGTNFHIRSRSPDGKKKDIIIPMALNPSIDFYISPPLFSSFFSFCPLPPNSLFCAAWSLRVNNSALSYLSPNLDARVPTMSVLLSALSRVNPVPSFPAYTGPYNVGTQELEIPISDLPASSPPPDANITTVSFRIFYPCAPTKPRSAYWLPTPQGEYFCAYARFLSAGPRLASFLRYITLQVRGTLEL